MKKLFVVIILIIFSTSFVYAKESYDVEEFIKEASKYSNDCFPELSDKNFLEDVLKGKIDLNGKSIINKLLNFALGEFKENIDILLKVIGISLLCGILKSIQNSFGGNVSEIASFTCYMLIIILIISCFTNISSICIQTIKNLSGFMKILIPVIIAIIVSTGNMATALTMQGAILVMINVISGIIANFAIPLIMISTILNLVSSVTSQLSIEKLSSTIKKTVMYIIEFSMIILAGILSLEGSLASSVDGMTVKVTKTIVSNSVPVVGKLLSDASDSVIGAFLVTKNAVGTIGIIIIVIIIVSPLIKSFVLMTLFNVASRNLRYYFR